MRNQVVLRGTVGYGCNQSEDVPRESFGACTKGNFISSSIPLNSDPAAHVKKHKRRRRPD